MSSPPEEDNAFSETDVDLAWDRFLQIFNTAIDAVAPLRLVSPRYFSSSASVRTIFRRKRRAFRAFRLTPSFQTLLEYERTCVVMQKLVDRDLARKETRIANTADPKLFWSYVNKRVANKAPITSLFHSGEVIHDSSEIASIFNSFFVSNYANTCNNVHNPIDESDEEYSHTGLTDFSVNVEEVMHVLKCIPPKSSKDADGLSYKILKQGGFPFCLQLLKVFRL